MKFNQEKNQEYIETLKSSWPITILDTLCNKHTTSSPFAILFSVKGRDIPAVDISTVRAMRTELVSLRDRINRILDKLEDTYPEPPKPTTPHITETLEGLLLQVITLWYLLLHKILLT